MVVYIDDILILAETKEASRNQVETLVYLLEVVGFIVNQKKSIMSPTQSRLPAQKLKKIRAEARKMAQEASVSARDLARHLECNSMCVASGSAILPPPAEEPVTSPEQQYSVLQGSGCTAERS